MKIENLLWKIERRLRMVALIFNKRPSSYPYISGDGFRAIADHIFEKTGQNIDTEKILKDDVVFVQSDLILEFFNRIHPKIKTSYVLITHNGDENITEKYLKFIDDKISHWFAQNLLIEHPKMTPLPIGLENAHHTQNGIKKFFDKEKAKSVIKNGRILSAFSIESNRAIREKVSNEIKNNTLIDKLDFKPTPRKYLEILNEYSYVVSPPGNGKDCHRTWEALYLGTVPVTQSSYMTEYFKKIGLPIVTTSDWKNVNIYELPKNINKDALFMDYWAKLIKRK